VAASKIGSEIGVDSARAARTIALPGIGVDGQRALAAARVVVIGAGGLGSPVLQYLAGSGVGTIGIVDFDLVDLSNLHRQVIHRTSSVGELKTSSAARFVAGLNPDVRVAEHPLRLEGDNALDLLRDYDIVVDASDNFATRYLVSDCAALLRKPYVWGSVLQFDGQSAVFWEGAPDGTSSDYRDLHPVPPDPDQVLSCSDAGVLGSLCGTIGSLMATDTLKLITGVGRVELGRVQDIDALSGTWREFRVRRSPERVRVEALIDYDAFCGGVRALDERGVASELTVEEFAARRASGVTVIDVREPHEHDLGHLNGDRLVPLATLLAEPHLAGEGPVVVYCATGVRSAKAAAALVRSGIPAVSLRGGFTAWRLANPVEG